MNVCPEPGSPRSHPRHPRIPMAPISAWCREQVRIAAAKRSQDGVNARANERYGSSQEVADRLWIHTRDLNRLCRGVRAGSRGSRENRGEWPSDTVSRYYVEDMLTRAGVDFYDVYPDLEYERDIQLEADAYCRRCGEDVTPVNGECLWCGRVVRRDVVLAWTAERWASSAAVSTLGAT